MNRYLFTVRSFVLWVCTASLLAPGLASAASLLDQARSAPGALARLQPNKDAGPLPVVPLSFDEPAFLADAEPSAPPVRTEADAEAVPPFSYYFWQFLPDLEGGTARVFNRDNVPVAAVGIALTGLAFTQDDAVRDYFRDRAPLEHVSKYGDKVLGQGYVHVIVGAAIWGIGELADNRKLTDTGDATLEALLVNGIATEALKYAAHRKRPNGGDHMSFPSGHTSSTATLAATISEMYDWNPWIATPLYLTTAFVGATRIQDNQHHFSDVLAGLTLGTVIGSSFGKFHKEKNAAGVKDAGPAVSLIPFFEDGARGLMLSMQF